jgi:hypothetical protein
MRQRRKVRRFRANAVRIDRLAAAERNDELLHCHAANVPHFT